MLQDLYQMVRNPAGMTGRAQALDQTTEQAQAAGQLQVLHKPHLARLQAVCTEAMSPERHCSALSHGIHNMTTGVTTAGLGTGMMLTKTEAMTTADRVLATTAGIISMTDTGAMTEALTELTPMTTALTEEEEVAAPAQAAELLLPAEIGTDLGSKTGAGIGSLTRRTLV